MNIFIKQDEVGEYSYWRHLKSTNIKVPGGEEKKKEKQLKIANLLINHAKVEVKATSKYKVPISKEVNIINKWKELYQADKELETMRCRYKVILSKSMIFTNIS